MAKDDYDMIVYKVLVYLYACLKRKIVFDKLVFLKTVADGIDEEYLSSVLRLMSMEGLIEGVAFTKAWGNVYIRISDLCEMSITAAGIRYLKENRGMKKAAEAVKEGAEMIASLATLLGAL